MTTPPDSSFSDDLRLARQGDPGALGRVLGRYRSALLRQAKRRMHGLEGKLRPSDLLQSTYVDAVKHLESLREDTEVGVYSWLMAILDNNIRDRRKHFATRKRRGIEAPQSEHELRDPAAVAPDDVAEAQERDAEVVAAMAALPERYRQVLMLRRDEGLDNPGIAQALGLPEGAVRSLLSRARRALLQRIDSARRGKDGS